MTEFDAGRRQGLRDAAALLEQHHETTSNQPPYRYLSPRRRRMPDLTNSAFIEELRRLADLLS